jgi:hypothetical protein
VIDSVPMTDFTGWHLAGPLKPLPGGTAPKPRQWSLTSPCGAMALDLYHEQDWRGKRVRRVATGGAVALLPPFEKPRGKWQRAETEAQEDEYRQREIGVIESVFRAAIGKGLL